MRRQILYFISALLLSVKIYAQAPQQMNYQAVVRDAAGKPLPANTTVGVKFIIHKDTKTGPEAFSETTTATTNQFGLITLKIGANSNLAVVDWSTGKRFLQVLVDIRGGSNYIDMGSEELTSVPYALFAANSLPGPPGATGATGPAGPTGPTGSGGGATGPSWDISSQTFNTNGTLTFKTTKPDSVTTTRAAWLNGGNAGTNPATSSIGTTDNQPFIVKTNGTSASNERMRFLSNPQIVMNGTVPFQDVVLTVYGSRATNALNSVYGQTGTPIAAFSADTNIAIYANNTGMGTGLYGQNTSLGTGVVGESTGPANNIGAGVYGGSVNGWGIFGISQSIASFLSPAYPAILGYGASTTGTGSAGLGNGLTTYYTYYDNVTGAAGAGGAFTGQTIGVYGYAYGSNKIISAGGYFQDSLSFGQSTYAAVAAYILGTKYKIYGDGVVSTVVADNNNSKRIMYAPEAPEVLFQDYGEAKLVNGHAVITLDPVFAKNILVDDKHALRVILQPKGECEGLYVTNDNQYGFEVKEMKGGQSNIRFSYQVVANRADEVVNNVVASKYANLRFPQYVPPATPKAQTVGKNAVAK